MRFCVVVTDGKGGLKVQISNNLSNKISIAGTRIHEGQHIKDFLKFATNIKEALKDAEAGLEIVPLTFQTDFTRNIETRAYLADLQYFKSQLAVFKKN